MTNQQQNTEAQQAVQLASIQGGIAGKWASYNAACQAGHTQILL